VYDVHTNSSENSSLNPKELSPKGKTEWSFVGAKNLAVILAEIMLFRILIMAFRDATYAAHSKSRGASVAAKRCNDCSDGVQPLHTNSP